MCCSGQDLPCIGNIDAMSTGIVHGSALWCVTLQSCHVRMACALCRQSVSSFCINVVPGSTCVSIIQCCVRCCVHCCIHSCVVDGNVPLDSATVCCCCVCEYHHPAGLCYVSATTSCVMGRPRMVRSKSASVDAQLATHANHLFNVK